MSTDLALGLVIAIISVVDAILYFWVGRRINRLVSVQEQHRAIIASNVEGLAGVRGRLSQVEHQLGRTMRAVGVPGNPE